MGKPVCYTGLGPSAKKLVDPIPVKKLPEVQADLKKRIKEAREAVKAAELTLKSALNECDCSYFKDEAGFPFNNRYCVVCGSHIYDL